MKIELIIAELRSVTDMLILRGERGELMNALLASAARFERRVEGELPIIGSEEGESLSRWRKENEMDK